MTGLLLLLVVAVVVLSVPAGAIPSPCSDQQIRLAGTSGDRYGRVEVCVNSTWGTVCSDESWDNKDASVVCRQAGFFPYGAIALRAHWTESVLDTFLFSLNCTGNEGSVWECAHDSVNGICSGNQDAAVICSVSLSVPASNCSDGDVRLVGGSNMFEGTVEVCINRAWGSVCRASSSSSNFWNVQEGQVVCTQLGHQRLGSTVYSISPYGEGQGPSFLTNLGCSGGEESLLDCPSQFVTDELCSSHTRDVGVKCEALCTSGTIRLVNTSVSPSSIHQGRVEVCINNTWGTVCDDFWDDQDASVLCGQLGYSSIGAISVRGRNVESVWPVYINDVNCTGEEESIWDCPHNGITGYSCNHRDDASVICHDKELMRSNCSTGDVRLFGGESEYEGTVEICINQVWGSVCRSTSTFSNQWNVQEGRVLCGQLGYQRLGSTVYSISPYGESQGPSFLTNLGCSGSEESLLDCLSQFVTDELCSSHARDVGVKCVELCTSGTIRLVNTSVSPSSIHQGRVEVCINKTWGTVCDDFWDDQDASVLCGQLGYSSIGAISVRGVNVESVWPVYINDVNCTGEEESIWDCPHNGITGYSCNHRDDASIICHDKELIRSNCSTGDVRLFGGESEYEGTVEICINQVWGSVCRSTITFSNQWNVQEGQVLCGQLGYQRLGSTVYSISPYGESQGPSFLANLGCSGSEESLLDCPSQFVTDELCSSHTRDVGVKCEALCTSGTIRLVNTSVSPSNIHQGRVEVCINNTWGTVCDDFWDDQDASVLCGQLGYSSIGAISVRGRNVESVWPVYINDVNCTGEEESIWDCPHNGITGYSCNHRDDASVICHDKELMRSNCSTGDVRLFGGESEYEGTVEICINQVWGSVCRSTISFSNQWNVQEGQVLCGQLGYQRLGSTVYSISPYGEGQGPSFLTNLRCSGGEESLLDCPSQFVTDELCSSHTRDVGVKCVALCDDGSVRLTSSGNSHYRNYGSVELCIGDNWRAVCTDYWDDQDGVVLCHQLGYSRHGATVSRAFRSVWSFATKSLNCSGEETSFEECSSLIEPTCSELRYEAFLYCQYNNTEYSECTTDDLRLVGGSTNATGVVEVCKNNAWGTMCSDFFHANDARVVCRQLGFQDGNGLVESFSSLSISLQTTTLGPLLPLRPNCLGSEGTLSDCPPVNGASRYTCYRYRYAAVSCYEPCQDDELELMGTSSPLAGIPRVCVDNRWGKVCSNNARNSELASVICSQLGYSRYGAVGMAGLWSESLHLYNLMDVVCSGNETNILECSHERIFTTFCSSSSHFAVICQHNTTFVTSENCSDGDVRLTGGSSPGRGRVEVCRNRAWGSVCHSGSSLTSDARVICRQIGLPNFVSLYQTLASPNAPPMFNGFRCSSSELSLNQCPYPAGVLNSIINCGSGTMGIECEGRCEHGQVRWFRPGSGRYYTIGRVEVCVGGIWGTVCSRDTHWDNRDASVACRHLGYSQYGAVALPVVLTESILPHLLSDVQCNGTENSLVDCQHNEGGLGCRSTDDASIFCQDLEVASVPDNCTDGEVTLTSHQAPNIGIPKICASRYWSFICGDAWDNNDASILCGELGFQPRGTSSTTFGYQTGFERPFPMRFHCSSTLSEGRLSECSQTFSTCNSIVSKLECTDLCDEGELRLTQFTTSQFGQVEVCVNRTWQTICADTWTANNTRVVCRQLGLSDTQGEYADSFHSQRNGPLSTYTPQCSGDEDSLQDCHRIQHQCGTTSPNIAIKCTGHFNCTTHGEVRLSGGRSEYEGRVEICLNGQWSRICNNNWNVKDSGVTCRQLGHPASGAKRITVTDGIGPVYSNFFCSGSETHLVNCSQPVEAPSFCASLRDVGVSCRAPCQPDGSLQLYSSGGFTNQGILEVCVNGSWGRVCGDNWDISQTQVVCEQLGHSRYGAVNTVQRLTDFIGQYFDYNCNETEAFNCNFTTLSCTSRNVVDVNCQDPVTVNSSECTDYDVRLTGGNGNNTGTVEICINQYWSTVCRQNFNREEASVVCASLGFQRYGTKTFTSRQRFSKLLLYRLDCSGPESDISECQFSYFTKRLQCSNFDVAGLTCEVDCMEGEVRLSGTSLQNQYHGRVEICVENQWNSVCGDVWTEQNAMVVCRQLRYSEYGSIPYLQGHDSRRESSLPVYSQSISCNGTEDELQRCSQQSLSNQICTSNRDAFAICFFENLGSNDNCSTWDMRVSGQTADNPSRLETIEGRLELCYNKNWFSIHSRFSRSALNKNTICQTLGYGVNTDSALIIVKNFGVDARVSNLSPFPVELSCGSGTTHISECIRNTSVFFFVSSFQVGVRCVPVCENTDIRISQSPYLYGRVEVCVNETWGTICQSGWDDYDSSVLCKQLGNSPHGSLVLPNSYQTSNLPVVVGSLSCSGQESSISDCLQSDCSTRNDASVVCQDKNVHSSNCPNATLRIVDGPSHLEGRLEVCLNNVWGTVCGFNWDSNDAAVACRELGHQPSAVISSNPFSFYGSGEGPPLLVLYCTGTEASIFDCRYDKLIPATSTTLCHEGSRAGILCEESCPEEEVRVRGSSNTMIGRVEVCIRETWRTVCSDQWSEEDARVICHQLGFSTFGAIPLRGHFPAGNSIPIGVYSLSCAGGEQNWTECNYVIHRQPTACASTASVSCQATTTVGSNCSNGDIRLSGGSSSSGGYVQVCINSAWGSVCGSNWDYRDGNVVCRQLGFLPQGSITNQRSQFRLVSGPTFLSDVRCGGDEATIFECQHQLLGQLCSTFDATVICEVPCVNGAIRLAGGSTNEWGRVEVCSNKTWGTLCGSDWGNEEASVVCRELGFSPFGAVAVADVMELQTTVWPITIFHIDCHGDESALSECRMNDTVSRRCNGLQAALICQDAQTIQAECSDGDIRLVGGASENEGRVELCLNSAWGTVCDDFWGREEASVVCRQLGYQPEGAVSYSNAHFGRGSGPVYIRSISCSGNELSLLECPRDSYIQHTCRHSEDASVRCEETCDHGDIRTAGTSQNSIGVVQICLNNTWRIICSDSWDNMDASVACRQLGFSPHGAITSDDITVRTDLISQITYNINCLGTEFEILSCPLQVLDDQSMCSAASIVCPTDSEYSDCTSGQVRLSSGTVPHHGRVEVCVNNAWGTVCDRNWNAADGNVVCKQLGYQPTGSIPRFSSFFGSGSLPVLLGGLQCAGSEGSLTECERDDRTLLSCARLTIAGVECKVLDACTERPCQNEGVCVPLESGYRCECPDNYGGVNCETPVATSETLTAPVIAQPPTNSSIPIYTSVNLSCIAMGTPTPQYTWFKDGALIEGETQPFLYIPEVQPSDRGSYKCKAVNSLGEATSEIATLTIPGILQYTSQIELSASSQRDLEILAQALTSREIAGTNTSILFVNITNSVTMNNTVEGTLLITLLYPQERPTPSQLAFIRKALFDELRAASVAITDPVVRRYDGCDAVEYLSYLWPETNLGVTALVSCPCEEYLGTFAGEVRRLCNGTFTEGAMWSPSIDDSSCETLRSDLSRQLCDLAMGLSNRTVENSRLIADVTSQSENLTAPHVSIVSNVVEQLTEEASTNPEVRDNYLQTIDNIQQADEDAVFESQQEQNSSTRILQSLGTFLDNVDTSSLLSNSTDNVTVFTYTTFSLQIQQIDVNSFTGQTLIVALGSFELARNRSEQIDQEDLITVDSLLNITDANRLNYTDDSATASIQIPPSLSDKLNSCFALDNMSSNFQRLSYSIFISDSLFQPQNRSQFRVASIILAPRFQCPLENLSIPIQTTFTTLPMEEEASQCAVFSSDNFGGWDSSGCREVFHASGEVTCECAQLGHFGLLLDLNPKSSPPAAAIALSVITYIGLALSLICLAIFILTYLISKKLRSNVHGQVLVNMSVSLMALYIAFLLGGLVTKVPALCGIVSALLQYFFLVFFAWTAVESVWLYLKLVAVLGAQSFTSRFMLKAALPAWLLPLLIVVISVAAGHQYYISNYYCRATEWPFWFGHIFFFVVVYIFNWVMFSIIMVSIYKHNKNMNVMKEKTPAEKVKDVKKNFIIAMSLSVVLGLGWGLGLAATSSSVVELTITFQIIFSIFVGLQGVLIFILHGIRNKDARELWKNNLVTRSKTLLSSLKSTSTATSTRGTDSTGFNTLPRSTVSRGAKVDLSVAPEKSTTEETKSDLSEMRVLSGHESRSQENLIDDTTR